MTEGQSINELPTWLTFFDQGHTSSVNNKGVY